MDRMDFKYVTVLWIYVIYLTSINLCEWSPTYLGCFLNENLNISYGINVSLTSMTPEACSNECHTKNYTYAANNELVCRCSNNYMSKLMKEMDDDCNVSCTGNTTNKCQTHFKMFKIQNTSQESYPQAIYLGCYGEKMGDDKNRLLKFPHERYADNSPQKCSEECFKIGFSYSGLTNGEITGGACWCGNQLPSKQFKVNELKCNIPCPGDKTKYCGGLWRLSVYSTGLVDYPLGDSVGCFNKDKFNESNKVISTLKENIETQRCFLICNERGYKYSGVSEDHCECSNEKPSIDQQKKQEECNKCQGDESEYCGGPSTISVHENKYWSSVGELYKNHFGCFKNSWMYPVMEGWNLLFPQGLTSQDCASSCYSREYPYAALVSPTDCLCSFVSPSLEAKVDRRECNATCSGGTEHVCGDRTRYNVYTTGLKTSRVAGDYFMGCYQEQESNRMLVRYTAKEFPYVNTPRICSKHCDRAGFHYFGLSYRETCWCGDIPPDESLRTFDESCSIQCSGDASKYCGGVMTMAMFHIGTVSDYIQNCSTDCECYFMPRYNTTNIDCSKSNLKTLPTIFSVIENTSSLIHLLLRDNLIEIQPNLTSLRITSLDISNNRLTTLNSNLMPKSLKVLYIDNNKLTSMNDDVLKLLHSLDNITLSNNLWSCECHMKALLLKYKSKIKDLNNITCSSSTLPVIHMSEYELCEMWKISYFYISIVLGFISFFCFLSIYFNLHKIAWSYIRDKLRIYCCNLIDRNHKNENSLETFMQRIQLDELVLATDNWNVNRLLGEGGFGVVYKGNWRHTDVAIKRLKASGVAEKVVNMHTLGDGLTNPSKEIMYLNAVKHDNILSMYGFCFHPTGSCLIYQYMANGSLEDRLQRKNGTPSLSWSTRGNIAMGSAKGLQFLHNLDTPLIHGDIKSANILIDSNLEPRIGDFGLARTGPLAEIDDTDGFNVSRVCGTKPYLPTDFLRSKKLSTKVDTYSFGVVLFEIATGLNAFDRNKHYRYLTTFVSNYNTSSLSEIADKTAGQDLLNIFSILVALGKMCVAETAKNRPEMVSIYMCLRNYVSSSSKFDSTSNTQRSTAILIKDEFKDKPYETLLKQLNELEARLSQNLDTDLIKLNGRKSALKAPLGKNPSISDFYSNNVQDLDPRKIITDPKYRTNEIVVIDSNTIQYHT